MKSHCCLGKCEAKARGVARILTFCLQIQSSGDEPFGWQAIVDLSVKKRWLTVRTATVDLSVKKRWLTVRNKKGPKSQPCLFGGSGVNPRGKLCLTPGDIQTVNQQKQRPGKQYITLRTFWGKRSETSAAPNCCT